MNPWGTGGIRTRGAGQFWVVSPGLAQLCPKSIRGSRLFLIQVTVVAQLSLRERCGDTQQCHRGLSSEEGSGVLSVSQGIPVGFQQFLK